MTEPNVARFPGFDGLRAIAATLIVLHHAGFASGATFTSDGGVFLGRMDVGVPIFFVISGFLLYRPFVAAQFAGVPAPDAGEFWLKRFLRIFPAYWAALAIQLVLGVVAVAGFSGLVLSSTLTHSYTVEHAVSGITQSWSLSTEIAFYAALPFFARWTAARVAGSTVNRQAGRLLAWCAVLYLASFVWRVLLEEIGWSITQVSANWFPSLADLFALGMALAVISAWADHRPMVRRLAHDVGRHTAVWWAVALGAFWYVSTQLDLFLGLDRTSFERETLRQFVYGVIGLCIVAPVALHRGSPGRLRRALDSRVMTTLGVLSYGIYLWHQAFLRWVREWMDWQVFEGHFAELFVAAYVLSVGAAWVSYRVLELRVARLRPRRRTTREQELVAP